MKKKPDLVLVSDNSKIIRKATPNKKSEQLSMMLVIESQKNEVLNKRLTQSELEEKASELFKKSPFGKYIHSLEQDKLQG